MYKVQEQINNKCKIRTAYNENVHLRKRKLWKTFLVLF